MIVHKNNISELIDAVITITNTCSEGEFAKYYKSMAKDLKAVRDSDMRLSSEEKTILEELIKRLEYDR